MAGGSGRGTDKSVCATLVPARGGTTAGCSSREMHAKLRAMKTIAAFLLLLAAVPALAQSTADTIIARELQSARAYETLSHLTDDIGARLTGSKGAALAV